MTGKQPTDYHGPSIWTIRDEVKDEPLKDPNERFTFFQSTDNKSSSVIPWWVWLIVIAMVIIIIRIIIRSLSK